MTSETTKMKLLSWKDVFKQCYLNDYEDKKRYVSVDELVVELQNKLDDLNKDDSRVTDIGKDWEAFTIEWVLGLLGVEEK